MNNVEKFAILKAHGHKLDTGLFIGTMVADMLNAETPIHNWVYEGINEASLMIKLDDCQGHKVYLVLDENDLLDFDIQVHSKNTGVTYDREQLRHELIDILLITLPEGIQGLFYGK